MFNGKSLGELDASLICPEHDVLAVGGDLVNFWEQCNMILVETGAMPRTADARHRFVVEMNDNR